MHRHDERGFLSWALNGDVAAINFAAAFFHITQVWDDLIDRDKPVTDADINTMMWSALITIPMNPFYRKHQDFLVPLLSQYISDWMDANELEQGNEHARTIAYTLRDQASTLVTQCAFLIGGLEWSRRVGPEVRAFVHDDPISEYIETLKKVEG